MFTKKPRGGIAAFAGGLVAAALLLGTSPAAFATDQPANPQGNAILSTEQPESLANLPLTEDAAEDAAVEEAKASPSAPPAPSPSALSSTGPTFVVDSLESHGDATIGDGICATAEGDCTFLAALQEANATAPGGDAITITFSDDLGEATITPVHADRMSTDALPGVEGAAGLGTAGSNYLVDAGVPVTIDFGGNISIFQPNDLDVAGILINSSNVTIKNSPNIRAGSAAYVIAAENVVIANSTVSDPGSPILEVGIGLMNGAKNVTVTDFTANSVWHSAIAVAQGQQVSDITINGLTVSSDGGDNTAGVYFATQLDASTPTIASNFNLANASFEGISQRANIRLAGTGTEVDGLRVTDSVFANTSNGGYGLLVEDRASLKNATVTGNTFQTRGQHNVWVRGYGVIEDSQVTNNMATDTLYLFGAEHYWTSLTNVELSGNTVLGQTGGDSAVYLRSLMDNVTIADNTFENITANVVIRVHGPNGVDEVKDVTIENNRFIDLEGTLIEAIYLQHNVTNGTIHGNEFIQTEEWLTANPAYDHNWAIRTASAAGWTITNNHIDGYGVRGFTEAPIRVHTNGVTAVTGNTFGPRTNGTTDTREAETGARWFLWNVVPSNGQIQTLRPEGTGLDGTKATFVAAEVTPEPGNTNVDGPFTLHVYWTAADHAEEYLGAIEDVNAGQQVSVPTTHTDGFLRVQTVSQTTGNVSQYSGLAETTHGPALSIFGATCEAPMGFDESNENWRIATTANGTQVVMAPQPAGWSDSEGLPPGSVTSLDLDSNWTELWTPELAANGYLSDYEDMYGDTVQFNYLAEGADYDLYFSVVAEDGTNYWYIFKDQVETDVWSTITVPLDVTAEGWHTSFNNDTGPTGPAPTEVELRAALSDVSRFAISFEGVHGPDQTWVDNFVTECDDEAPAAPAAPVVTDVTEVAVSGTGEPEATISVRDSEGIEVATAMVDAEGNWTASNLICGTTYTVVQTVGGIESATSTFTTAECAIDPGTKDDEKKPNGDLAKTGSGALLGVSGIAALLLAAGGLGLVLTRRRQLS